MSNTGLTYETVSPIIEGLVTKGIYPTISKIREALNNQGSVPMLSRYLKQWRATYQGELPPEPVVEPKIIRTSPASVETDDDRQPSFPALDLEGSLITPPASEVPTMHPTPFDASSNEPTIVSHPPRQHHRQPRSVQPQEPITPVKQVDFDKPYPEMPENLQNLTADSFKLPRATEPSSIESLEALRKEDLITKVRRLESALQKEQLRAEASEKLAYQGKLYADTVKNMVAERIHATRDAMQHTIDQLKLEAREVKLATEKMLSHYRQQLDKANQKIIELMPVQDSKN